MVISNRRIMYEITVIPLSIQFFNNTGYRREGNKYPSLHKCLILALTTNPVLYTKSWTQNTLDHATET